MANFISPQLELWAILFSAVKLLFRAKEKVADVFIQESGLVPGIAHGEIQIRVGGHLQDGYPNGLQGLFYVALKAFGCPHIVVFPGSHLGNEVVGIGTQRWLTCPFMQSPFCSVTKLVNTLSLLLGKFV